MAAQFNVQYLETASALVFNPVGNIFLRIRHRFRKLCRDPFNGEETVLEDYIVSEHGLPQIDIPPDALELASSRSLFIRNALLSFNLDTPLREYLHKLLTDTSVYLSRGGRGFCLYALIEAVNVEVAESTAIDRVIKRVEWIPVIKKLLKRRMDNHVDVKQVGGSCAVCLEELMMGDESEDGAKLIVPMPCSHVFHQNCIFRWLEEDNSCPVCRAVGLEPADFDLLP